MSHRLFLAIDLPDDQRQLVAALLTRLAASNLPVRWEPPEKLHLTLNFLGRVDDSTLSLLHHRLPAATTTVPAFNLRLSYLEPLYRRHGGSLVYLAPTGDLDHLKRLQKSLSLVLTGLSLPQPIRFQPHFLIGRLTKADPTFIKHTLDQISQEEFIPLPSFSVDHITLYASFLSRKGSTYQKIGRFALK